MNPLVTAHNRFRSRFKFINGSSFLGQILEPPDTARVSNFLSARRYLRTSNNTPVKPREVVVINGLKFIVAEHGDGFYVTPIYKHFKLFEVDEVAPCYPATRQVNPVTGVHTLERGDCIGDIYLSTQPSSSIVDMMHTPVEQKVAISNYPLLVNDKVGDFIVTKSDIVLGVTLVTLKEM